MTNKIMTKINETILWIKTTGRLHIRGQPSVNHWLQLPYCIGTMFQTPATTRRTTV